MLCENVANEKMVVFKLSPELGDGQSVFVEASVENVLSAVRTFCEYALAGEHEAGEHCRIEIGEMNRLEFKSLPDL